MRVGIVKEIKNSENRVAIIPANVQEFTRRGHQVFIQHGAGEGSGFSDEEYAEAGAVLCSKAETVWENAELLYKVKEILPPEYKYLRDDLVLMTYIHSNSHREQTDELLKSGIVSIALEDVSSDDPMKKWPLVANMGELLFLSTNINLGVSFSWLGGNIYNETEQKKPYSISLILSFDF